MVGMLVDRLSIALEGELGQSVREAAAREGVTVSRWMSDAAAAHLRNRLLGEALDRFEAEDGPFTQEELDRAASLLGLSTAAGAGGDDPRS